MHKPVEKTPARKHPKNIESATARGESEATQLSLLIVSQAESFAFAEQNQAKFQHCEPKPCGMRGVLPGGGANVLHGVSATPLRRTHSLTAHKRVFRPDCKRFFKPVHFFHNFFSSVFDKPSPRDVCFLPCTLLKPSLFPRQTHGFGFHLTASLIWPGWPRRTARLLTWPGRSYGTRCPVKADAVLGFRYHDRWRVFHPGLPDYVFRADRRRPGFLMMLNIARHVVPYRVDRHRWNRLRREILNAEPYCRSCRSKNQFRAANEVDHIVALHHGGSAWDRGNLQPLCRRCHSKKSAAEKHRRTALMCPHGFALGGDWECPTCKTDKARRKKFMEGSA